MVTINKIIVLLSLMFFSSYSLAAEWFDDVAAQMGRIEQDSSGDIWLMTPTAATTFVTVNGTSTSCQVNSIWLVPPTGKDNAWLSMVMSAVVASKKINVYGVCDSTNKWIQATRLVMEF